MYMWTVASRVRFTQPIWFTRRQVLNTQEEKTNEVNLGKRFCLVQGTTRTNQAMAHQNGSYASHPSIISSTVGIGEPPRQSFVIKLSLLLASRT
jgi:hypothetical protein